MRGPEPVGDLAIVGLGRQAEIVYRLVLAVGPTSPDLVASDARLAGIDAHAALEHLRGLGLVTRISGEERYSAVDPRVALRTLADRTATGLDRLRAAIPALARTFEQVKDAAEPHPSVRVLTSPDMIGTWYNRLEHLVEHEFLAFDRPPYILAPENPVEPQVLARGVEWRAVYAAESLERPGAWNEIRRAAGLGEQARIAHSLPLKLAIADRRIAIVSASLDPAQPEAIVIESPPLIDTLCFVFETVWATAAVVPPEVAAGPVVSATDGAGAPDTPGAPDAPDAPDADDVELLALFSAGAKDEVIARELGLSSRTVRRRSAELLRRLGAVNRFQAGAEAARRGWI